MTSRYYWSKIEGSAPCVYHQKRERVSIRVSVLDTKNMKKALNLMVELKNEGFEIFGTSGWGGDESIVTVVLSREVDEKYGDIYIEGEIT